MQESKCRIFHGRTNDVDKLSSFLHGDIGVEKMIVVSGEAGVGKSALLANLAKTFEEKNPQFVVLFVENSFDLIRLFICFVYFYCFSLFFSGATLLE
jgi:predicted ATP-dependent serine protease